MSMRFLAGAALAAAALLPLAGAGASPARDPICALATASRATPSHACLACHDGSATRAVAVSWAHGTPGEDVHPVEVEYRAAARRNPRLAPPHDLPRPIVLVGGRVTCTSCHDGASPHPSHIAGGKAKLCASCHRM